jgi:hypothetical protein
MCDHSWVFFITDVLKFSGGYYAFWFIAFGLPAPPAALGIPLSTGRTFTNPFCTFSPTVLAEIACSNFGHCLDFIQHI